MSNHRDRKLLDKTRELTVCQFQLPGVCQKYQDWGCEPAHSNSQRDGKGMGIKAHDYMHVASCHSCHVEYDAGAKFTKQEKQDYFDAGWARTMKYYWFHAMVGPK